MSQAKNVEGSWEVRFDGFEWLSTERGKIVKSPVFECLGHKWIVGIFPGGASGESDDGMVTVGIGNTSQRTQSISMSFSLCVRNSAGRVVQVNNCHADTPVRFDSEGDVRIYQDFASRSSLLGALRGGALVIEVAMKLFDPAKPPRPFAVENPFSKNMLKLFLEEESADVAFEVDGDGPTPFLFHAHRFIVKDGAPILYELCKSGGKVMISDVKADVLRHLLFYLYGGELSSEVLEANAKDLIDAADRYGAAHLKLTAEAEYVKSTITFDTAMDTLTYADSKNCALLKEAVMDFLVEHKDEAIEKVSFGVESVPPYFMKDLLTAVAARYREKDASGAAANGYNTMRVEALRKQLHEKGLEIDGSRETMIALLREHS